MKVHREVLKENKVGVLLQDDRKKLKNALKKLETLFVNFGLKLVKVPLSRFSKKNLIVKDKRGKWTIVPCQLNTGKHCVLCSDGVKQTWRAAFKILDYRGTWDSDKKRFKNDKPVEKIWIVGSTIANSLKQVRDKDKKGRELNQMVLEVTRSGEGKDSTYNFEQAFDEDDKRMRPIDWDEQGMTAEEYCQPPTEDEIDEAGYTDED